MPEERVVGLIEKMGLKSKRTESNMGLLNYTHNGIIMESVDVSVSNARATGVV